MDLRLRINIELAKATNYLILGNWSDLISYKLSDAGVPVVRVPDDTSLGYSVYALNVAESTVGASPAGAGSSEWRLVESAEFIYMQAAYIERLQAAIVTAERIEALNIRTSLLEVLEGAKVGGFDIGSGRIGKTQDGDDPSNNGLSLYNEFIKFSNAYASVFLGTNVLSGTTGTSAMMRLINNHAGGYGSKWGAIISVSGNESVDGSNPNIAVDIQNGVVNGFRMQVRPVNINNSPFFGAYTFGNETVLVVYASNTSSVTLPSNPQVGDIRYIIGVNNHNVLLIGSSSRQIKPGHVSPVNSVSIIGQSSSYPGSKFVIWDGNYWLLLSI
ncbi:hypothetical protein SAMN05216357_11093 [Porphyromonadaceae bacterium KH3CP3RA]|nr:hypothetical protein SAMN05216357_11093 [Porphyromonadaceae bacterium KH3CP3RA]